MPDPDKGIARLATKEGRRQFHESGLLLDYPGLESGITSKGLYREILHSGMRGTEYFLRGTAYHAGRSRAAGMGLIGDAAEAHAWRGVNRTQFDYSKASPIVSLELKMPHQKVFGTYPRKEFDFIRTVYETAAKRRDR